MKQNSSSRTLLPLFLVCAMFVGLSQLSADVLVIFNSNKEPKYVVDTTTGKMTRVDGAYYEGAPGPQPPGDGGGDTPTPPPQGDVAKISDMSKSVLNTSKEGQALAFVVHTLAKQAEAGRLKDIEGSLSAAVGVLSPIIKDKGRYSEWIKKLKEIKGTPLDTQALKDGAAGLAAAFDVKLPDLAVVGEAVESGNVVGAQATTEYAIDISLIITLIMQILELLKNLGILG